MRLYLAREALDPHLRLAGGAMDSRLSLGTRLLTAIKAGIHYSIWYPGQYLPSLDTSPSGTSRRTRKALRYVERTSRRLSRSLFHAMALHGPALEKKQLLLGRLVDVAGELFALTTSHLRDRCDSCRQGNLRGNQERRPAHHSRLPRCPHPQPGPEPI